MHAHSDVAEVLDRLGELATVRRPDDSLLAPFLSLYYSELPGEDVDDRKIDDIYAVGVAHLDLGRKRPAGSAVIRVVSPDREHDGWSTPHSVVLVVTDDMPFLVDTIRMMLERHGFDIRLLVHPILLVERDGADVIQRVAPFSDRVEGRADESLLVEAWTQIEVDRVDDEPGIDDRGRARCGYRRRTPGGHRLRPDPRPPARVDPRPPGVAMARRRAVRVPRRHRHDVRRRRQRRADLRHRARPARRRRTRGRCRLHVPDVRHARRGRR